MKKNNSRVAIMFIITAMLINIFPSFSSAEEMQKVDNKSNIDVKMSMDESTGVDQSTVKFTLEYKAKNGFNSIKQGDKITFKVPKSLKNFKFKFPPQHFKDVKVVGDTVVAEFGDNVETALGGYVKISATKKNISGNVTERISIEVNGQVVSSIDIEIKPNEEDHSEGVTVIDRELIKVVDGDYTTDSMGNIVGKVYAPVVGKTKEYTIYVNEKFSEINNARLIDKMPEGMNLVQESLEIIKVDKSGNESIITNEVQVSNTPQGIDINFGNIDSQYIVKYKGKITKDLNQYINIATLYGEDRELTSKVIVNKSEEKGCIINKYSYGTEQVEVEEGKVVNVASLGDEVSYAVEVNKNKVALENVTLQDYTPQGMELIQDSVYIGKYDKENNFKWVIDEFKDKIKIDNGNLTVDFGSIHDNYVVYYKMKIKEVKKSYDNKARVSHDGKSQEVEDTVKYEVNVGAINAYKSADKQKIEKGDDTKVTYAINFDSYGVFEKGYLDVMDKLDPRAKILKVEASEHFTVTIDKDTNTVNAINNNKEVEYGENLEVKIYVDLAEVEDGSTVSNIASINDTPTNEVTVKKGYKFQARKVDANNKVVYLPGAKFSLKDSEGNLIKELTSNENGIVESEIDRPGIYYLEEVQAPKGYLLTNDRVKFTISEDDIGNTVDLGTIENSKINEVIIDHETIPEEGVEVIDPIVPEVANPTEEPDHLHKPEVNQPVVEGNGEEVVEVIPEEGVEVIDPIVPEVVTPTEEPDHLHKPEVNQHIIGGIGEEVVEIIPEESLEIIEPIIPQYAKPSVEPEHNGEKVEENPHKKEDSSVPKTGDTSSVKYIMFIIISALGIFLLRK